MSTTVYIGKLERRITNLARLIHYPSLWDTEVYPTLESAFGAVGDTLKANKESEPKCDCGVIHFLECSSRSKINE